MVRAKELLGRLNRPHLHIRTAYSTWFVNLFRGNAAEALAGVDEMIQLGESLGMPAAIALGHACNTQTYCSMGDLALSPEHLGKAIDCTDTDACASIAKSMIATEAHTQAYIASISAHWLSGFPEKSLRAVQLIERRIAVIDEPLTTCMGASYSLLAYVVRREPEKLLEARGKAFGICEKFGSAEGLVAVRRFVALGHCERGDWDLGLPMKRELLQEELRIGAHRSLACDLGFFASALIRAGQRDEAGAALKSQSEIIARTGMRAWLSDHHRLTAILAQSDDSQLAEAQFGQALMIARQQGARSLELRTAISFAEFLSDRGRRTEARTVLQPALGWFTEGFDTPDLVHARQILDGL